LHYESTSMAWVFVISFCVLLFFSSIILLSLNWILFLLQSSFLCFLYGIYSFKISK
jgi:hypothetical protein